MSLVPSPNLARVSIDFSKFPPRPFSTVKFRFSSRKPISRIFPSFASSSCKPDVDSPTDDPNTLEGLLLAIGGDGDRAASCALNCSLFLDFDDLNDIALANPNLPPLDFGGNGGSGGEFRSSDSVLPVSCRLVGSVRGRC